MNFSYPSSASLICFVVLLTAILSAIIAGAYFAGYKNKKLATKRVLSTATGATIWLSIVSVIVQSGVLAAAPMPRLLIFFGFVNLVSIGFALSPLGGWVSTGLPLGILVAFQGFRFPLELILHSWAEQKVIPLTMTWSGSNFDIVSGVLAILLAPLVHRHRSLAWIFNGIGFALLINVIRVAVFSSPLPFGWDVEPKLLLAFHLPYAFIVPICIGGALFGHVVLTRRLLNARSRR
jgi:hypothetical protein